MSEYTRREIVRRSVAATALAFVPVVPAVSRRAGRTQTDRTQAVIPGLDVNGFFASMKSGLAGVNGYSMELRRHGVPIGSYSSGNAVDGVSPASWPREPGTIRTSTSTCAGS